MKRHVHLLVIPKIESDKTIHFDNIFFIDLEEVKLSATYMKNPPSYFIKPLNCGRTGYVFAIGLDIVDHKELKLVPVLIGPIDEIEWRKRVSHGIVFRDSIITESDTIYFLSSGYISSLSPRQSNIIINYYSTIIGKMISECTEYLEIPDKWFARRLIFKECIDGSFEIKYKLVRLKMPDLLKIKLILKLNHKRENRMIYISRIEEADNKTCNSLIKELILVSHTLFNSRIPLSEYVERYIDMLIANNRYVQLVENCIQDTCRPILLDPDFQFHYNEILRFHKYLSDIIRKDKLR